MPSEEKAVDIAVAGVGFIGRRHINFLKGLKTFKLVAAADPVSGAESYLKEQGIPYYSDFRRMLDVARPDCVLVATPNQVHEDVALACIERKIPALIEKPIAHTIESARRICAAVEKSGVAVLVGHHRRHNPLMRTACDFIKGGGIGQCLAIAAYDLRRKADSYFKSAWRREPGGGPMLINGIHDVDCLRALCGEIESLVAFTANKGRGFPVEDTAAVTFKFESGAIGNLTISDAVQAPWAWELNSGEEPEYPYVDADCYLVTGTEGALGIPTLTHWRNESGGGRADPFLRKQLFYVPSDPWVEELIHFAQVVRGKARPLVTADDGTRTLAATLAVAQSAATGRPVALKDIYAQG